MSCSQKLLKDCSSCFFCFRGRNEGNTEESFLISLTRRDSRNASRKFLRVYETSIGFTSNPTFPTRYNRSRREFPFQWKKHSRNRFLIRKPKKIAALNRGTKSFSKLPTNARFFKTNIAAKSHSIIGQLHFGSNMCNYRAKINCFSVFFLSARRETRTRALVEEKFTACR